MDATLNFDYVIVGGGSAGCILANRLSADANVRVALVEAGVDTPPGAVPDAIADSYPMPLFHGARYIWPTLQARATRTSIPKVYEQGRVMGGGSSINVQSANRGLPRDYNEWCTHGATGWGWDDVLPYFKRLESDLDFPGTPMHGANGPLPIRRIAKARWPDFCLGFASGLEAIGMKELSDQNGEFGDGYFATPFSNRDDCRATSASAYLSTVIRARQNLRIFSQTQVLGLVFADEGTTGAGGFRMVTGVIARDVSGQQLHLCAMRETILSAGALQTPALLLRAGVGDGAELQRVGVPVRHHLGGVGKNLQDHPSLTFCHFLPPAFRAPDTLRRATMMAARLSSGWALKPEPGTGSDARSDNADLYLSCATRAGWHGLAKRFGLFFLWCNRPLSRGSVRLASADPEAMPLVDLNLLDAPEDVARLASGVKLMAAAVAASPLSHAPHIDHRDFIPAAFSARVKALSQVTPANKRLTGLLGVALDAPMALRHWMLNKWVSHGVDVASLLSDADRLERFIRSNVFGVWHASGTCRMGDPRDAMTVTDTEGRVCGIGGLRVVDASVMPRLPSANTNIPVMMIAEKMADAILQRHTSSAL